MILGDFNFPNHRYKPLIEGVFHNLNDADMGHLRMGRIDEHVAFGRHQGRWNTKEKALF